MLTKVVSVLAQTVTGSWTVPSMMGFIGYASEWVLLGHQKDWAHIQKGTMVVAGPGLTTKGQRDCTFALSGTLVPVEVSKPKEPVSSRRRRRK